MAMCVSDSGGWILLCWCLCLLGFLLGDPAEVWPAAGILALITAGAWISGGDRDRERHA